MAPPARIRINTQVPFPSQVTGSGPVTVTKQNGIWSVGLQVANLAQMPANTDPTKAQVLLWNVVLSTWQSTTLAIVAGTAIAPTSIAFGASPYTPVQGDSVLYVDTSGGPIVINLPLAGSRGGLPLTIKDTTGHAATNNITIKPAGAETIDGYTNGSPLIVNSNYGGFRLYTATGSWVIAP
jgi:hypothetical protein